MENNAIIIRANNQFKSKSLNTATAGLAKAFKNIENGRKDACAILAKVELNKSYVDDGFKSLAEYAETIGLNKSLAHKMENAGRLLISEDQQIKDFADKVDFSKLAILSSAPTEEIKKAIEEGTLTTETTQSEVKAIKANMGKSNKEKVLPKYNVTIEHENGTRELFENIELENVVMLDNLVKVGTFDTEEETPQKWTVYADPASRRLYKVSLEKVKKEKAKVKSVKNFTVDELRAMLEKAIADQDAENGNE